MYDSPTMSLEGDTIQCATLPPFPVGPQRFVFSQVRSCVFACMRNLSRYDWRANLTNRARRYLNVVRVCALRGLWWCKWPLCKVRCVWSSFWLKSGCWRRLAAATRRVRMAYVVWNAVLRWVEVMCRKGDNHWWSPATTAPASSPACRSWIPLNALCSK